MTELVSVIMPVYNGEEFIAKSIQSIVKQTHQNWEVIVVDDGSTDSTKSIIKSLIETDSRIKYFYQHNLKQGVARNTGIVRSKGDIIAFLDADDIWLENKLEVNIAEFRKGDYDVVFSDSYIFENDRDLENLKSQKTFSISHLEYHGREGLESFLFFNRIPNLTVMFKKEIVENVGFFSDRGISEDYDMWLRLLLKNYSFKSIPLPLAAYRVHSTSTTNNDKLAVDNTIDVLIKVSQWALNPYKSLVNKYLKVWCARKIKSVRNIKDLNLFISYISDKLNMRWELVALSHFDCELNILLNLKKRLALFLLK